MKKSAIAFLVPLLLAASSAFAAEMFESYPKKYSLGYVSNAVDGGYWFNPAWGLDASLGFTNNSTKNRVDDGVVDARDRNHSGAYSFSVAGVRAIKDYAYFNLNLKAGFSYSQDRAHTDPEGPNNTVNEIVRSYSLFSGPEVEIKLPYFSRLVVVSSIQLAYEVDTDTKETETIGGTTLRKNRSKTFTTRSDGNSLNELFHIGVRYYF